jgi:hypothetical protein
MNRKTIRWALAALVLMLFGLVVSAQTPAELARQKKRERQHKGQAGAPNTASSPNAPGAPGTPAPRGVVPPGSSPLTRGSAAGGPATATPPGPAPGTATGTPPAPRAAGAPGAPDAGQGVLPGSTPPPALGDIDQILEGEEAVLSGNGYSYDPGNRRDPFKSLLAAPDRQEFRGPRPEGVPGLLIDEIDLTGVFKTSHGYVAQVKAANQAKSYLLKEGDQLYDGDVVSISHKEVVFKQTVQDPTALKPFREVVKTLSP